MRLVAFSICLAALAQSGGFEPDRKAGLDRIRQGRLKEAIPYLERAYKADPSHYANCWDLALAYNETRQWAQARRVLMGMPADKGEVHNLLGTVEESLGNFRRAAVEFHKAADIEPSEKNLIDLGKHLALHNSFSDAFRIFDWALQKYPQSSALHVALGVAQYAAGNFDEAAQTLCKAVDLTPDDTRPIEFLGRMIEVSPQFNDEIRSRLANYVRLYPDHARANHYYAMSLAASDPALAEKHFRIAETQDPRFAETPLQLGILFERENKPVEARRALQKAIVLAPSLETAHYHLARVYQRLGQADLSRQEFATFQQLKNKRESQEAARRQH